MKEFRTHERLTLKIRYRLPNKRFGTKLVLSNKPEIHNKAEKGKCIGVRKVSDEKLFKIGENLVDAFTPEFQKEFKGRIS